VVLDLPVHQVQLEVLAHPEHPALQVPVERLVLVVLLVWQVLQDRSARLAQVDL